MNQSLKCIATAFIFTLALTGCHHAVTTAKTPQAPPPQPAAPEAVPAGSLPLRRRPVVAKKPELSDEQLFAQNVKDIFFSYDNADVRADEQQTVSVDAAFLASHPR